MKNINQITWLESNQATTVASVKVDYEFNIYNYRTSPYTMKLSNILAAGGTVVINNKAHQLEDQETVEHFQLEQLEYLIGKYNKVTGDGARLARKFFTSRQEATAYFESPAWEAEKARHFKLNVLEVLVPTLTEAQEQILLENAIKEAKKKESIMNLEMLRAGVRREDLLKDLPNQGVTTAFAPTIEAQQKIGEYGPYVTFTGRETSTHLQVIESRIVNAWLYNQTEFRVPSKEEQANELEELREWFQMYKDSMRVMNQDLVMQYRQADEIVTKEAVAKFERLETLEIEVGAYLEERIASHILY